MNYENVTKFKKNVTLQILFLQVLLTEVIS